MPRGPLVLFLIATFLLGATAGVVAEATVFAPASPDPEPEAALTADEIAAMCADVNPSQVQQLKTAQEQVVTLQTELATKEAELAAAEAEAAKSKDGATAAAAKVKALQGEVTKLKSKVAAVVKERDQLLVDLRTAVDNLALQVEETEVQKAEATRWRSTATGHAWTAFVSDATVKICDRGTAKRHDRCEEAVHAALGPAFRERFQQCVDSGQASPAIGQVDPKKGALPEFAVRLVDDKDFGSKHWYVQLCDPTLPEAGGEGILPERAATPDERQASRSFADPAN